MAESAVCVDNKFKPTGPRIPAPADSIPGQGISPFIVMHSTPGDNPIRMRLENMLGKQGQSLLNRLWPAASVFHILRGTTGEEVTRLSLPAHESPNIYRTIVHPDPNGQGLILQDEWALSYWEFHPTSHWYPWIGLCIGLLLGILVTRWNLRRAIRR